MSDGIRHDNSLAVGKWKTKKNEWGKKCFQKRKSKIIVRKRRNWESKQLHATPGRPSTL